MENSVVSRRVVEDAIDAGYIPVQLFTDNKDSPVEVEYRAMLHRMVGSKAVPIPTYVIVENDGTTVVDKRIGRVSLDAFLRFVKRQ